MRQKDFCTIAGISEKTFSSMMSRESCPDIWFMAVTSDIFRLGFTALITPHEEEEFSTLLTYQEKTILSLLRQGSQEVQRRNYNTVAAMLTLQRGESLKSLNKTKPEFYSVVFNEFGLVPYEKQAMFDFMNEFEDEEDSEDDEEDPDDNIPPLMREFNYAPWPKKKKKNKNKN